jgi:hypothetical protein
MTTSASEKEATFEYRRKWREGTYEWWRRQEADQPQHDSRAITLTLRDVFGGKLREGTFANWLDSWLVASGCTGVLVVETTRGDGRLHAHGVVSGPKTKVRRALDSWKRTKGYTLDKPITDKMGWIMYMFKAVNEESTVLWRRSEREHDSYVTPERL